MCVKTVGSDTVPNLLFYFDTMTTRRIEPLGEIACRPKVNVKQSLVHDTEAYSDRLQIRS